MKDQPTPAATTSRDLLRQALLSSKVKERKSEIVTLFGMEVEVKQQSIAEMMNVTDNADGAVTAAQMVIRFCYVPGTDERIFEEGDIPTIQEWPFGEDVVKLQQVITKLQGINIEVAKEDLKKDPLDSVSST